MKDGKVSVVEVIPIVKGLARDNLTYFTKDNLEPGSFVKVPVRNSVANGVVENIRDAKSAKSELRQAPFVLKKLSDKKLGGSLSPAFMRAAKKTAQYYATSVGSILGITLPKFILEEPTILGAKLNEKKSLTSLIPPHEPLVIQSEEEERLSTYAKFVREGFAKGKSTLLIVPTNEDALRIYRSLSKGIQDFVFVYEANRTQKELKKLWITAREEKHPVLFISTPQGISFEREDLKLIIIERENSRAYRTFSRPYINFKTFFEYYSKECRRQLIYGDSVLSIEALWKFKEGTYGEAEPVKWRLPYGQHSVLVDMKGENKKEKKFEIFSSEMKALFDKAQSENANVLLFGTRKGLYPTTVCSDCGTVLACNNCGAPMVLYGRDESRRYLCHACGKTRPAETACGYCRSWNLTPLGIGLDKIAEEARKFYTSDKIFILDKDRASTTAKAKKIVKDFQSTRGALLVATELAFLFIDRIPYSGAVSLDPLFSIPDFSINEKIFYLASHLAEISQCGTVIQTRNIGKQMLFWAACGNILEFYKEEITDRESIMYPPFGIFVKVSLLDKPKDWEAKLEILKRDFSDWKPDFYRGSMIIRLPREKWPEPDLVRKLSLLSPEFLIKVDPESIL